MVAEALCALGRSERAVAWVEGYRGPDLRLPAPGSRSSATTGGAPSASGRARRAGRSRSRGTATGGTSSRPSSRKRPGTRCSTPGRAPGSRSLRRRHPRGHPHRSRACAARAAGDEGEAGGAGARARLLGLGLPGDGAATAGPRKRRSSDGPRRLPLTRRRTAASRGEHRRRSARGRELPGFAAARAKARDRLRRLGGRRRGSGALRAHRHVRPGVPAAWDDGAARGHDRVRPRR